MDKFIAAQITGTIDFRTAEQVDDPITTDERNLAIDVAYEWATQYDIDLAALVAEQHERETDAIDSMEKRRKHHEKVRLA